MTAPLLTASGALAAVNPLATTTGPTAYWYLTRATGAVALVLLTVVTVLGVLGSLGVTGGRYWPRFAIGSVHRDLSLLAIAFIVIHVITTVLDGFAPITLFDAVVPFRSPYRPLWLGLGAVALDLLLAVVITSLVRRRLGYSAWRAVHWLAYASWPVAVLHGLGTGTDGKQGWYLLLSFASVVVVSAAVIARVRGDEVSDARRSLAIFASVATPIAIGIFALLGPLAPHWAERAGTPTKLIFGASASRHTLAALPKRVPPPLKVPFDGALSGTIRQSTVPGGAVIDLNLSVTGGADGQLRIRLVGAPAGQGLSMAGSQVDLAAHGLPVVFAGKVVELQGSSLVANVSAPGRRPLTLAVVLNIDQQTGLVTGTVRGQPA